MGKDSGAGKRNIRIFRYDPAQGGQGYFDGFELAIGDEASTTIVDVLLRVQREHDPTLAFRYACRVNMCGSCALVINGKEALACKTTISQIPHGQDIVLRPLNHFPVIKDLMVDLEPFFQRFAENLAFYEPKDHGCEPALIPTESRERKEIGNSTECIACGCCVSSCTMCRKQDYAGPAALNRVFSLLADSRDRLFEERFARALGSCYDCRTEFACTEVCPKEISGTRAIKGIQFMAMKHRPDRQLPPSGAQSFAGAPQLDEQPERRAFLRQAVVGAIGLGASCILGTAAVGAAAAPGLTQTAKQWVSVGKVEDLPEGVVVTVPVSYEIRSGFYVQRVTTPVMLSRTPDEIVCFKAECPHLGCQVGWDAASGTFRCGCHGGRFDRNGQVLAGPPPKELERYAHMVELGQILVEVG